MGTTHSPKGLRISDEVHRALRVRAAETGETMGEIAERALRKELGMMLIDVIATGEGWTELVETIDARLTGETEEEQIAEAMRISIHALT